MIAIDLQISLSELEDFFNSKNWLEPQEKIENISNPGEGNMNVVLRIKTSERSLILKQSRPFVQKYQEIKAPLERIEVEHHFYKAIANKSAQEHFPEIYGYDPENYLLLMQDLGNCEDMSRFYNKGPFSDKTLNTLVDILNTIHNQKNLPNYPLNQELRTLNHQHIFVLPFMEDNGFDLDGIQKGLQDLSISYKTDNALKKEIEKLGQLYLSQGETLLHGDFYPGSWMQSEEKIYVIDPEFSFMGFKEFDLGVMIAHSIMGNMDLKVIGVVIDRYQSGAELSLVEQVAGVEIMRRLIGLAQLPLKRSLKEKDYLLRMAKKMILR
ncbi:MAG: phosphotransferase [Eudoraea sp.]|uniref:phosphotransferase n=1 Tax=Eudoraea sp. TaxID=1979955 RepID=UPI003C73CCCA